MKTYKPIIRSNWMDDERVHVPSMTVIEPEGGWVDTGLLDASGTPLMSRESIGPIGLVTDFTKSVVPAKPKRKKR